MNEKQSGMLDYLTSQCRCVTDQAEVTGKPIGDRELGVVISCLWGKVQLLCIAEDNIKTRLDERKNATWRHDGGFYDYDAVAVFYAPAWEKGAVWEEPTGNKFKDDYRRLSWVEDVIPHPKLNGLWDEIEKRMTEENLRDLMTGKRVLL